MLDRPLLPMAMDGLVIVGVTLAAGTALGLVRRRGAALRRAATRPGRGGAMPVTREDLGESLGERATLVQFSTAFCQPCRATRRVLADVAAMVPGVAHVEIDAESRLDLVRRFGVLRTPTVLVLDAAGRVTRRASGQPRKADVIAALGEAIKDRDGGSGR